MIFFHKMFTIIKNSINKSHFKIIKQTKRIQRYVNNCFFSPDFSLDNSLIRDVYLNSFSW